MLHLYFAPLEGITTYPYRNLHHKYFGGVDKYFTPFLAPGPEQGMSVKEMRDVLPFCYLSSLLSSRFLGGFGPKNW